jgi:hypothetical protein
MPTKYSRQNTHTCQMSKLNFNYSTVTSNIKLSGSIYVMPKLHCLSKLQLRHDIYTVEELNTSNNVHGCKI